MNKKNWISALLAVMMVISMMACIVVPVAAEEYTLPNDAVNVSTVAAVESGAQNYKMESIADLVYVMNHASYFDVNDTIYLANDIDTEDYEGGSAAFKTAYEAATCTGTSYFYPSIDGLGHTIYNYHANRSVFANHSPRNNGFIKNISFVNAEAATTGHQGLVVYRPELSVKNGATTIMENIHVKNAKISSSSGNSASVFGYINTGDIKNITIRNCSVINTEVTSTSEYGVGILVGRGRTDGVLTLENILVAGCTLNNSGRAKEGGGLIVGDTVQDDPSTGSATYTNIGIFNNTTVLTKSTLGTIETSGAAVLTNVYGKESTSDASKVTINGIYAAGNKVQQYDGSVVPFDRILTSGKNKGANLLGYSNIKTDGIANVMVKGSGSTSLIAADSSTMDASYTMWKTGLADAGWGIDTTGNFTYLAANEKAPVAVSFTVDSETTTYYTDVNGNLRVTVDENGLPVLADTAAIAALSTSDWKATNGEAVNAGADWTKVVVDEDTAYNEVTLPPIAIKLDKETYSKGEIVTATVSLIEGANLAAIQVGFTYDEAVLAPVTTGENALKQYDVVNASGFLAQSEPVAASDKVVSVYAVAPDNVATAADVFTIKFRVTQDIASKATALALTAKLEYACSIDDNGTTEKTEAEIAAYTEFAVMADIQNAQIEDYSHITTPASEAYWGDGVSEYYIDSVGELIRMNMAYVQARYGKYGYNTGDGRRANDNFEPDDVIYLTNDLDMSDWDYQSFATYEEGVGYIPEKIFTVSGSAYTYIDNTYTQAFETQEELFSALYTGMVLQNDSAKMWALNRFTFDGLGHTIYNYTAHCPFFNNNFVGIIRNLTFEGANVTNKVLTETGVTVGPAILVGGSTYITLTTNEADTTGWTQNKYALTIDNVHINNSVLNVTAGDTAGLFVCSVNQQQYKYKPVHIQNCSAVGSKIIGKDVTNVSGYGFLAGRLSANTTWVENVLFADCLITTGGNTYHSMLVGSGADNTKGWTFHDVAMVNCELVSPTATANNVGIISSLKQNSSSVSFKNIYVSGNTFATKEAGEKTPATNLLVLPGAVTNYSKVPTMSNIVADANVVNAIYWTADTTKNKAVNANKSDRSHVVL